MIATMLNDEEYQVVEATDGKQAIKLYNQGPFELVITDIIMPEMEGLETIRELKRISMDIKIIAISGGGRGSAMDYLYLAQKMGADIALPKPFLKKKLLEAMQRLVV